MLFGVLTDNPSTYTMLNNVRPLTGATRTAQLNISDLPDRAQGWSMLDALIISNVDTGTLTAAQKQALELWLANGGKLFVTGGIQWQTTAAGLSDLLPIKLTVHAKSDGAACPVCLCVGFNSAGNRSNSGNGGSGNWREYSRRTEWHSFADRKTNRVWQSLLSSPPTRACSRSTTGMGCRISTSILLAFKSPKPSWAYWRMGFLSGKHRAFHPARTFASILCLHLLLAWVVHHHHWSRKLFRPAPHEADRTGLGHSARAGGHLHQPRIFFRICISRHKSHFESHHAGASLAGSGPGTDHRPGRLVFANSNDIQRGKSGSIPDVSVSRSINENLQGNNDWLSLKNDTGNTLPDVRVEIGGMQSMGMEGYLPALVHSTRSYTHSLRQHPSPQRQHYQHQQVHAKRCRPRHPQRMGSSRRHCAK